MESIGRKHSAVPANPKGNQNRKARVLEDGGGISRAVVGPQNIPGTRFQLRAVFLGQQVPINFLEIVPFTTGARQEHFLIEVKNIRVFEISFRVVVTRGHQMPGVDPKKTLEHPGDETRAGAMHAEHEKHERGLPSDGIVDFLRWTEAVGDLLLMMQPAPRLVVAGDGNKLARLFFFAAEEQ